MNLFGHQEGKKIEKVFGLYPGYEEPVSSPFAVFFMSEERSGLFITLHGINFQIKFQTYDEITEEYCIDIGESEIFELPDDDPLKKMSGETIKSVRVAIYDTHKLKGDHFIITENVFAGIILQTTQYKLT